MPKIIVLVDKEGKTQTIVKGIVGSSCLNADKFVTGALGEVASEVKTEEYDGISLFPDSGVSNNTAAIKRNINFSD